MQLIVKIIIIYYNEKSARTGLDFNAFLIVKQMRECHQIGSTAVAINSFLLTFVASNVR